MMVSLLMLGSLATTAEAKVYPVPLDVADEADLRRLVADEVLSEDDFTTLVDLLDAPLDINYANSAQLFDLPGLSLGVCRTIVIERRKRGEFTTLDDLQRIDGITPDMIEQLRPFAIAGPKIKLTNARVGVQLRARVAWTGIPVAPLEDDHPNRTHTARQLGYDTLPQGYISTRVDYGRWLEGGFLGMMTEGPYAPKFTPETGQIHAEWGRPLLDFGKAYLKVQRGPYEAILGSYTLGFGLGTVFDRTTRDRPSGFYRDLIVTGVEGDFRVRRGQFGFAGTVRDMDVGGLRLSATLFGSMNPQDVYQYRSAYLTDPTQDPYNGASSPTLFVQDTQGTWQKLGYETLPNLVREDLIGGNLTLAIRDRTEIGVTTYAGQARPRLSVVGAAEDRWRLRLRNGYDAEKFGAVGAHISTGIGPIDAVVEYARSWDSSAEDGLGGNGLQGLFVWSEDWGTIEASVRYYDTGFDNPLAAGTANMDQYRGQRDRDEVGGRVEATLWPLEQLKVRVYGDVWQNLSLRRDNYELFGRVDGMPIDGLRISLMGTTRNRDIRLNGRSRIYGGDYGEAFYAEDGGLSLAPPDDVVLDGAGARHFWGAEVRTSNLPMTTLTAFYRRSYEDIGRLYPNSGQACEYWYMIGHYAWLRADLRPVDGTTISARVRYRDDDVFGSRNDEFIDAFLQLRQDLPANLKLTVRGTLGSNLPDTTYAYREACDPTRSAADPYPEIDTTVYLPPGLYGWAWAALEWRF